MHMSFNPTTLVVRITAVAKPAADGFDESIEIVQDDPNEEIIPSPVGIFGYEVSRVLYHHVQNIMYRAYKFQNMQLITINVVDEPEEPDPIPAIYLNAYPDTPAVTLGTPYVGYIYFTPEETTNKVLEAVSEDEGIVTITLDGLVTWGAETVAKFILNGVAAGTTIVRLTAEGGAQEVLTVTVA